MLIFAIDPGCDKSAYVFYDTESKRVLQHDITLNELVLTICQAPHAHSATLVVEQIQSYGMAVGAEVFATCWWAGRFHQAWRGHAYQLPRRDVKLHLCHSSRATDANVRQVILDRFARTKAEAIGTKKSPGPLHGIKAHEFAALAVALTWADLHGSESPHDDEEGQTARGMVLGRSVERIIGSRPVD